MSYISTVGPCYHVIEVECESEDSNEYNRLAAKTFAEYLKKDLAILSDFLKYKETYITDSDIPVLIYELPGKNTVVHLEIEISANSIGLKINDAGFSITWRFKGSKNSTAIFTVSNNMKISAKNGSYSSTQVGDSTTLKKYVAKCDVNYFFNYIKKTDLFAFSGIGNYSDIEGSSSHNGNFIFDKIIGTDDYAVITTAPQDNTIIKLDDEYKLYKTVTRVYSSNNNNTIFIKKIPIADTSNNVIALFKNLVKGFSNGVGTGVGGYTTGFKTELNSLISTESGEKYQQFFSNIFIKM